MEEGKPERCRCGGSRDTAYALLIQAYNTLSPDQAPAGRWQVMKGDWEAAPNVRARAVGAERQRLVAAGDGAR